MVEEGTVFGRQVEQQSRLIKATAGKTKLTRVHHPWGVIPAGKASYHVGNWIGLRSCTVGGWIG